MDSQKPTSPLSSVRTFARDLEKKRAERGTVTGKIASEPTLVEATKTTPAADPAEHKYQAPTWTGNKIKPSAVIKNTEASTPPTAVAPEPRVTPPEVTEKPKPTLKPLSAPKLEGDTNIVVENEDAATATIIRDTKKNRFRLFPAIFRSIRSWLSEQIEKQKNRKTPKYTVPEATRRKGVIQMATSKTGKITSFDHVSLQERIRQRQERTAPKTPGITWSANTEPGVLLLEAPEATIKNVEVVPKKSFRTPKVTPTPEIKLPLPPVFIEKPVSPLVVTQVAAVPHLTPTAPLVVAPPVPIVPQPIVTTVVTAPVPLPVGSVVPQITTLPRTSWREWLFTINTNTMAIVVALLVFLTSVFGVSSYFWITGEDTLNVSLSLNHPILLNAPLQLVTATTLERQPLFDLITQNYKESSFAVLQLLFVTDASGNTLVPTSSLVDALELQLNTALIQAITHIYFGSIKKTEPFILFKVTDTNTAQGGLLTWEAGMYQDLLPLLATNQTEAVEATKIALFVDDIIAGTDVRILRTLAGRELLLYGIVNRNTVIITTNRSAFESLAALKQ